MIWAPHKKEVHDVCLKTTTWPCNIDTHANII